MTSQHPATWRRELDRWLAPFLAALGHRARRRWAPRYLLGLLGPGERKAVQPLAAWVAPAGGEQLHHFVAASSWDTAPVEAALAREAQRLVGGRAPCSSSTTPPCPRGGTPRWAWPSSTAARSARRRTARRWSRSPSPGGRCRCPSRCGCSCRLRGRAT